MSNFGLAVIALILCFSLSGLRARFSRKVNDAPLELAEKIENLPILVVFLGIVVSVALEEIIFRGPIWLMMRFGCSIWVLIVTGIILSSIWSILHRQNKATIYKSYLALLQIFLFGIIYLFLLILTKNLFYPLAVHLVYNGLGILAILIARRSPNWQTKLRQS